MPGGDSSQNQLWRRCSSPSLHGHPRRRKGGHSWSPRTIEPPVRLLTAVIQSAPETAVFCRFFRSTTLPLSHPLFRGQAGMVRSPIVVHATLAVGIPGLPNGGQMVALAKAFVPAPPRMSTAPGTVCESGRPAVGCWRPPVTAGKIRANALVHTRLKLTFLFEILTR